jgi:1-acyl-sn-glycerol-3-phosphate acyltransferase
VIRALVVLLWMALFIPPATVLGVLGTLIGRSPRPIYVLARVCVRVGLFLAGVRVRVSGLEHLADWRNTVLMANHESQLDPPVLLHALPVDIKVLVKKELFKVPFLGTAMLGAGLIPVDRGNRERARISIERSVSALRSGLCFLVFPEGTRSATGELGPFKKGVFLAAMEAGSRIVPIALRGTRAVLPRGRFSIKPGEVTVELLPPLAADPAGDRDRLIEEVRGRIGVALAS